MWWCQIIDWLKFETRPRSLMNFGTAYCENYDVKQETVHCYTRKMLAAVPRDQSEH